MFSRYTGKDESGELVTLKTLHLLSTLALGKSSSNYGFFLTNTNTTPSAQPFLEGCASISAHPFSISHSHKHYFYAHVGKLSKGAF